MTTTRQHRDIYGAFHWESSERRECEQRGRRLRDSRRGGGTSDTRAKDQKLRDHTSEDQRSHSSALVEPGGL